MAAIREPTGGAVEAAADRRFRLHDVPWWMYVAMRDALDDTGIRMTYLEGELELMSPSYLHEDIKSVIARLLSQWAVECSVDLRCFGNATFRREAKQRGLEPDECYKLGRLSEDDVPDIAIEVVVSAPLLDKLAVYAGLGVREVWVWRDGALVVHALTDNGYAVRDGSGVLPDLDIVQLVGFVRPDENQTALVQAYRDVLAHR